MPVPAYKTWKNNYGYSAKVEVAGNTFKSTGIQGDHKEAQQSAAYNALISLGLIDSSVSFDVKTATGTVKANYYFWNQSFEIFDVIFVMILSADGCCSHLTKL